MQRVLLIALVALGCGTKSSTTTTPPPTPGSASAAPRDAASSTDAAPVQPVPLDRDLPRLAQRSVALYQAVSSRFAPPAPIAPPPRSNSASSTPRKPMSRPRT